MNAIGYAALALGLIVPGPIKRNRWLVRLALIGFTLMTIVGWLVIGARFPMAYLDKSIEVALVIVVGFDLWLADGGPLVIAGRIMELPGSLARAIKRTGLVMTYRSPPPADARRRGHRSGRRLRNHRRRRRTTADGACGRGGRGGRGHGVRPCRALGSGRRVLPARVREPRFRAAQRERDESPRVSRSSSARSSAARLPGPTRSRRSPRAGTHFAATSTRTWRAP